MKDRRLGRTGLKVSEICLGTMTFGNQCDEETSFAILDTAVDAGIYFFDLADVYPTPARLETVGRTETIFGHWLASRGNRESYVIATKCRGAMGPGPNDIGLSRKHIMTAVEGSLKRLGTDYIDLYHVHRSDPNTPIEETMEALTDLVRAGKVRYLGCSNYEGWELAGAALASERHKLSRYQCIQPRYNLLYRAPERDILPFCRAEGLGVIPYNAQAGGFLTGKYQRGQQPPEGTRFSDRMGASAVRYRGRYWHDYMFDALDQILAVAREIDCTGGQLGIAWLLAQPDVTAPIVGATSPAQLSDSLKGVSIQLDATILKRLDDVTQDFV